jgi:CubicO group peptidase (beta-lactamase class C family)
LKIAAQLTVTAEPTAGFLYSNLGYVIAGAMAEKAADAAWEDLMKKLIFEPLGMTGVGFGGVGTPGQIDQPWPHLANGKPAAGNGPAVDNPPVLGPAGTVHCRLSDWAKFVADQLRGERGEPALLKTETYRKLHAPPFPGGYALGWGIFEREWAGGTALAHDGSNSMNYASVSLGPARNTAILVVINQGGEGANLACDEVVTEILRRFRSK